MLISVLFSSFILIAQEERAEKKNSLITSFLEGKAATQEEKQNVQCELILIHEQYHEKNKENSKELLSAFEAVLSNYRETGELDISHRLFEAKSGHHSHRKIDEIKFVHVQEEAGKDKPFPGQGNYEKATTCINSDFETSTFDNWNLSFAGGGGAGNINPGADIGPMNGLIGNHAIMGPGAGMDGPSGNNLPRVFPGGGMYSFRIGDQGTGYEASRASYTFTVTPATELFLYHFAVVMQDPGHAAAQQPFMEVRLSIAGSNEACGEYYQAASGSAPGYISNGQVRYKPWETVSISLTPYMGQVATVTMTTADCAQFGHYGYAYVDAECMAMPNLNGSVLSCLDPTITLDGPPGASAYVWTGPGIVGPANTQNVTVNAPGTYEVEVIPVQGPTCSYTLQTIVTDERGTVTADFNAIPDQVCLGEVIDFEDNTTITGLAGTLASSAWNFGDGNTSGAFEPSHTYTTPGIYTVELAVETTNSCTDVITKNVTVSPIPVADFNIDSVCTGVNSTIADLSTVDATNGDNIAIWDWDFDDGQTSTSATPTLLYGSENLYDVTLEVTSNNGCSNTTTKTTAIYPNPVVDFSATNECLNFANSLTDLSTVSNTNTTNSNDQWNWDFGDGSTSTLQNPTYTYLAPGTFNATLTVETNNGCSENVIKPVVVYELPTADFDFTNACDNEDVSLESTAVPNEGVIANYFWDIENNGSIDYTVDPANHTYNQDGFYDVMHIVETSNGCRDTIVQQVTVYALPNAEFTVDAVCEDATTTFSNSSSVIPVDSDVISNYDWSFGEGNTSTAENPTHNYGSENVYDAELVITTNYGCKDSVTHPVSVYPLPIPDFTPTDVCLEDDSEFVDLSTVSNDHTTNSVVQWNWDFGDGTTSTQQNPDNEYASDGTFNAILSVVTNHGCVEEITKIVTVHPLPVVSFTGINLDGCSPVCPEVTTTTTINSPSTIANYDWTLSDGRTYQGPVLNDCYENNTGNSIFYGLTLQATSNEGCITSHTESSYIEIFHNPIANFYFEPNESSVIDTKVEFFNTSLYADEYEWTFGNEGTSINTNPVMEFSPNPQKHIITLVAKTFQGCTDTVRGVVDVLDKIVFHIPNTFTPDKDKFNEVFLPVFRHGFDPQGYTLYIFNRWGELVFESHDTEVGWNGTYGIESNKIVKEGTYVWKIIFKETMSDKHHTHTGHVNLLR
jgi:gliding motility-associated-like protein